MPYESRKQERFAHTESGLKAFGKKTVQEFDKASKGMKLPETKKKRKRLKDIRTESDSYGGSYQ